MCDLPWKPNFLKKAYASQRQVVPVFVEGELSNFFYRVASLRKALGIKFNIEMLWLPDEMFSQGASTSASASASRSAWRSSRRRGRSANRWSSYAKRPILKNSLDAGEKKR